MSSYSEIKADLRGVFLFLLFAALAVLGLSLFGALGLIVGIPEAFVVPGEAAGMFDVGDQIRRGGFFSEVPVLILFDTKSRSHKGVA